MGMLFGKQQTTGELFKLALPAIMENILYMVVWIVDTAMVGQVSATALAAVGLGGQFVFMFSWIFSSLGVGASTLVARAVGAKEPAAAERTAAHALALAAGFSLVLAIAGFLASPFLIGLLTKDSAVLSDGIAYSRILFAAVVFMVPLIVSNSILRGSGDTITPMLVAAVGNLFNIVGDYVLIFGKLGFPAMGVVGAAIASALSQVLGFSIMSYILFTGISRIRLHPRQLFHWHRDIMEKLITLSIPAAFEETLLNLGRTLYVALVSQLGTVAFAANQVVVSVESISFMPGYGFAVAASTLVGQRLGAGQKEEAVAAGYLGARLAAFVMAVIGLLFLIVPRPILTLFSKDPAVLTIGAVILQIAALEQIPIALEMTMAGAMRGAGDTRYPMFVTAIGNYLVRLPLVFLAVSILHQGLPVVWLITALDWSVRAVLLYARYRKEKWIKEVL